MTIKTESRTVQITLRYWRGGWNAGYDPDCFDDLEVNFPVDHPERAEDDDFAILAPEADTAELIAWWESECKEANAGYDHDEYGSYDEYLEFAPEHTLNALTDEQLERGDEWVLTVE